MHNPEKWMVKMAIGSEFLQEGNTFAKSVWLHLVEKVAQSLSSIITTLGKLVARVDVFEFVFLIVLTYLLWIADYEQGLEHVLNKRNSWEYQLFKIFVSNSKEILEVMNAKTVRNYQGQFPYSWAIIDHIDQLQDMDQ